MSNTYCDTSNDINDYKINRKLVTIHSEDRDICIYPNSNSFSVYVCPSIENVGSMRLIDCTFPTSYNTFSNDYQNTKLSFILRSLQLNSNDYELFTIEIQEGCYSPQELATELQVRMNEEVTLKRKTEDNNYLYNNLKVHYDSVGKRFYFGNTCEYFELAFDCREYYDLKCQQPEMCCNSVNWGLPAYIGFEKSNYKSTSCDELLFAYDSPTIWLSPNDNCNKVYYVKADFTPNIHGESVFYMEVDTGNQTCNSITELTPYVTNTNNLCNNDYNCKVNSAFAKIPIQNQYLGNLFDSRNGFLSNVKVFNGPQKISKLCFKFRYHDGRLVDFQNLPFNFTIELNEVKKYADSKINKNNGSIYNARVPSAYRL